MSGSIVQPTRTGSGDRIARSRGKRPQDVLIKLPYGLFAVASGNGQQQTARNHCHQFVEAFVEQHADLDFKKESVCIHRIQCRALNRDLLCADGQVTWYGRHVIQRELLAGAQTAKRLHNQGLFRNSSPYTLFITAGASSSRT